MLACLTANKSPYQPFMDIGKIVDITMIDVEQRTILDYYVDDVLQSRQRVYDPKFTREGN